MKTTLTTLLAIAGVTLGCGCAGERSEVGSPIRLTFLSDFEFRREGEALRRVGGHAVMELSGLAYDAPAGELVAVADDGQPARLYRFAVAIERGVLRVSGPREVLVRGADGGVLKPTIDAEGVAVAGDGYYLAVEGREKSGADGSPFRSDCAVLRLGADGRTVGEIELPPRYRPRVRRANGGRAGPRDNGSLESVALSPDGAAMLTAMQIPLIEDDLPRSTSRGGVVRIIRLRRAGTTYVPDAEFAYVLDPQPLPPKGSPAGDGEPWKDRNNGVVELVALTDWRLLVLEKGVVAGGSAGATSVRIYEVDLRGAANVSAIGSFAEVGPAAALDRAVRKRLVLNFDDVASRFTTPTVANYEGMAVGPRYAGRPTLILVSDDNGNDKRNVGRTVFAAFTVDGMTE